MIFRLTIFTVAMLLCANCILAYKLYSIETRENLYVHKAPNAHNEAAKRFLYKRAATSLHQCSRGNVKGDVYAKMLISVAPLKRQQEQSARRFAACITRRMGWVQSNSSDALDKTLLFHDLMALSTVRHFTVADTRGQIYVVEQCIDAQKNAYTKHVFKILRCMRDFGLYPSGDVMYLFSL